LLRNGSSGKYGDRYRLSRAGALEAWAHIARALSASDKPEDRRLSGEIERFVREADVSTSRDTRDRGPEISR